jgi:hypothetical protein
VGWPLFQYGYQVGRITPNEKEIYTSFEESGQRHQPPPYYEHFYAPVYSLENSFPLVKLGQVDRWQPDPSQGGYASFLRLFCWAQIILGWFFATMGIAGVTGIIRRD